MPAPGTANSLAGGQVRYEQVCRPGAGGAAAAPPQDYPAENENPQPAGGDLGVVPPDLAEMQVAVQVVEPGGGRGGAEPGGEPPGHLAGVRVDIDGVLLVAEFLEREHHLGGPVAGAGHHGGDGAVGVRRPRGGDLLGEGLRLVTDGGHGQPVAVEGLVQLRGDGVRQAGQGGDQQERGNQDAGVEMKPGQQRGERRGLAARPSGRRGGGGVRRGIAGQFGDGHRLLRSKISAFGSGWLVPVEPWAARLPCPDRVVGQVCQEVPSSA